MHQYQLVVKDSRGELNNAVTHLLTEGWQLGGGMSVTLLPEKDAVGKARFLYAQAMAKA